MKRATYLALLAFIFSGILALMNGCETTPAAGNPEITPSAATVRIGQSVAFSASGGSVYAWSLQNETMGRLDTRRGERVVYVSMYDPGSSTSAVQIITVSSTVSGSSETTNSPTFERSGEAYVTHISTNS
jgi:hypothetical protein